MSLEFIELIKGKRCIVLAPSAYLRSRGKEVCEVINEYDVVVKMTNMCEIEDVDNVLGDRCDIWYGFPEASNGWLLSLNHLINQKVRMMRFQPCFDIFAQRWQTRFKRFKSRYPDNSIPVSIADENVYNELRDKIDCVPFTGVFAIVDLLAHGAKEVFAYGHDFHRSGYFTGSTTIGVCHGTWHKPMPQMRFIWNLLKNEPKFKCDNNLRSILTEEFGSEPEILASRRTYLDEQLAELDISGPTLLFRSFNINHFVLLIQKIESEAFIRNVDIVCQGDMVDQLPPTQARILKYTEHTVFREKELLAQFGFEQSYYKYALIPYNGLEMINYYELIKLAHRLQIPQVYFISQRGAVRRLEDISAILEEMDWYLSLKKRFQAAQTNFDTRGFL